MTPTPTDEDFDRMHRVLTREVRDRVKIVRFRRANENCWSVVVTDETEDDDIVEVYRSENYEDCETFKHRMLRSATSEYIDPLHLIVALTKISLAITRVSQIAAAKDEAPNPGQSSNYATKAHMRAWANEAWAELDHAFESLCPPRSERAQKALTT